MVVSRQDATAGLPGEIGFRALVEAAGDIVALVAPDARIRFVNSAVSQVLGYSPSELIGRRFRDLMHPEDRERAQGSLGSIVDDPHAVLHPTIYRLKAADGRYRYLEFVSRNRVTDPALEGVCIVARDVSERLQDETARVATHERRRLVAQFARVGIWEWNVETRDLVADESVREIARQFPGQRWSGIDTFLERFVPEDRETLRNALRAAAAGDATCQVVARLRRADGSLRWLNFYAERMPSGQKPNPWLLGMVMDITEHKQAEQELLRRGELLELASWGADLGVWTWFPGEDRAVIDARSARLLGLPPAPLELPTAVCNSRVHPDDLPALLQLEQEVVAGTRDDFDYAYRVQRDDDSWHWLMDRGRVRERDAERRALRVAGVTLDIDQAKRAERELEEQRLRLDLALRGSQLGLWDFDIVNNDLYVDRRYSEITGFGTESVQLRQTIFDNHTHDEDLPRLVESARACIEGRADTLEFEGRLLGPEGRLKWIRLVGFVAARRPDGAATRMVGTIADVTRQRHGEQLTRIGESVARVGSYEFDIGADRFFWSPGVYQLFGYPEDFVPLRSVTRLAVMPGSRDVMARAFREAVELGHNFDIEIEVRTVSGRPIWVRDIGRVESFQGRPLRIYGIVQDITRRKRLERALLEAANREQQKLGRELHDGLGQELTGIALLLQGMAPQISASTPALAPRLDRLGGLLSSAIRSARDLAHGLAPVSTSRGGLEAALRLLTTRSAETAGLPVTLELALERPLDLDEVAGQHLYRIAQEALSNAVRHARPSAVTVRLGSTPGAVTLEVADDGCGIGDVSGSADGMGMQSMAFRAASLLGTLSVRPRDGGGTRVVVEVPRPQR